MTIHRRTIVLGLPTMAGLMLTGCQGDDGSPSSSANSASLNGHANAQAVATSGVSGSVHVSQSAGLVTTGVFPTTASNITPSSSLYQACFNGRELLILLRDSASTSSAGTSIRTIALKLVTSSSTGWQPSTTTTFDMTPGSSNNGSEGFIYHNPDYASSTPASAKYAYQMNKGQIIVSTGATLDYVTLEFSANTTWVSAIPVTGFSSNSATGYVYIPLSAVVTLKARQETEATV